MGQAQASDEKAARRERLAAGPVIAWRSLIDHSADVAAMFRALLLTPGTRARLEQLSRLSALSDAPISRLTVLAALHDFGKANRGFQALIRSKWAMALVALAVGGAMICVSVMAGLDPAISLQTDGSLGGQKICCDAAWMAGTRPAMTALPTFNPGPAANAIRAWAIFCFFRPCG